MKPFLVAFAVMVSQAFLASAAGAQQVPAPCGEFQLFPEYLTAERLDHAPGGHSLGDTRYVHMSMRDSDGNEVAQFIHTAVVVPGGSDGLQNLILDGYFVFEDGLLRAGTLYSRPDLTGLAPAGPDAFDIILHGGTGRYVGFNGVVRLTRDDEGRRVYSFNNPC
ncbi:MAG: hypothetical protein AAGC96_15930 [Pseudomonadota bacterium]